MILIVPAWSRQVEVPFLTILLLGTNILFFLITWPLELGRQGVVSRDQYQAQARDLSMLLLDPASGLKEEDRTVLQAEQVQEDYPTPQVLALFQRVDADALAVSSETRYRWKMTYPLFQSLVRSVVLNPGATTPFQTFGLKPHHNPIPGLLSHMFLHAGWMHLFFNMLFLWTAGLVLEPALKGSLVGLYILGGMAAAGAQLAWGVPAAQVMVGASGAIAALMGFALVAMPRARITLFYAHMVTLVPRAGTFESPLWFCVPLWALQQIFMLFMPLKGELANVGYAAHVGGFAFGALAGFLYSLTHSSELPATR